MMAVVVAIARYCMCVFVAYAHIQNIIKVAHFQIERNEGKKYAKLTAKDIELLLEFAL